MKADSAGRCSVGRRPSVTRVLSAVCLLVLVTGCAPFAKPRVEYLRESEKAIHLTKGEPAPHDGWLLSDDYLAELYDLLDRKLTEQDSPRE